MKKFKYKIAFDAGSIDKRDLIFAELKQLGYSEKDVANGTVAATGFNGSPYVMTSFGSHLYGERELISDKDTFLALAAMVDDDKFYKGEWVVCRKDFYKQFTKGNLYEVREDFNAGGVSSHVLIKLDDSGSTSNGLHHTHFSKATKEEIIDHFKDGKVSSATVAIDTETAPLNPSPKPIDFNSLELRSLAEILSSKPWYEAAQSKFYDDRIYVAGLAFQTSKPRYDKGFVTLGGLVPKSDIIFITKPKTKKHKLLTF